jgi:AraC family transcriptional regulator of adaptative response / DNA-3-methyladenine glycosylase II
MSQSGSNRPSAEKWDALVCAAMRRIQTWMFGLCSAAAENFVIREKAAAGAQIQCLKVASVFRSRRLRLRGVEPILGLNVRALDRARMSRDARFDGKFFIAITSTGIYCRPICPSRHAKRSNVRYFPTAASASAAGFRPCMRCRPEAAPGTPAWMGTSAVVRRALRLIDEGFLDRESVERLASRLGIGARHLHRLFLQHVGAAPLAMAQTRRLHFAKRLIDETQLPIVEIAFASGFRSIRRFNSAFLQTFDRSPRDVRRDHSADSVPRQTHEVTLKLSYRPPYDWNQVHDYLAARAVAGLERVDEHGYARTVRTAKDYAIVRVRPLADDALELAVYGAEPTALLTISSTARRVFDVASDPAVIVYAFQNDPLLGPLVQSCPGLRIPGAWDVFECAVRAILDQQATLSGDRELVSRFVQRAGPCVASGEHQLTYLFPTACELLRANLSCVGLTGSCAHTLRALAQAFHTGAIELSGTADNVCAKLSALPGVGERTAQYVALRALGEPDAFPTSDPALLRRLGAREQSTDSKQLAALSEAWRPWRGYAAMHLWRCCAEPVTETETKEIDEVGCPPGIRTPIC